jgi:hypothetical protein
LFNLGYLVYIHEFCPKVYGKPYNLCRKFNDHDNYHVKELIYSLCPS